MSTTTEIPPTEQPKPDHHDEFAGAFGFFRKYQKLILYTAGIFALITFSITGAMTSWVKGLTSGPSGPQPTISIAGNTVELDEEDRRIGGQLAQHRLALPQTVLPPFLFGSESSDLATRFAILRRVSLSLGLDVSMTEVDDAIGWMVKANNSRNKTDDTATQVALRLGLSSLAQYRGLVKEAMRIGNLVMLDSIGIDCGDAAVMKTILGGDDREKLTLRVATFDMKALEKELAAKGDVTEQNIKDWLKGKSDAEKGRLEVFDSNRVALTLGVARFDTFDPEQWKEELTNFTFGDEQQKMLYKRELGRFKDEKGKDKPLTDNDVVLGLKKIAQVDEVLNKLLTKLREELTKVQGPAIEKQKQVSEDKAKQDQLVVEAKKALEAKPDDADLQRKLREAQEASDAVGAAFTAATKAVDEARESFPFKDKFAEFTKDKKGFEVRTIGNPPGPNDVPPKVVRNAKELEKLDDVGLGDWKLPMLATALGQKGLLAGQVAHAQNGAFLIWTDHVDVRPEKDWETIKAHLQDKYFEEQAKKQGDEKKKHFEDELLRLAKEKIPEKVAEIEAKKQPEIDKQFADWQKKVQDDLAKATEKLASLTEGTQAHRAWLAKKDGLDTELKGSEAKKALITKTVGDKFDDEIKTEAKKKYAEVLEAASTAAGFTVAQLQPLRRDLRTQPLFNKRYDRTIVFMMGGIANDLKAGECTPISEDTMERRWQMAVCDKVEPITPADVSRREFEQKKRNFGALQLMTAISQSYSLDALQKRFDYKEPVGRQEAPKKDPPK